MKASFSEIRKKFNTNYRKNNLHSQLSGVACVDGKIREAVIVRIYHTESRTYCCVWAYNRGTCHNSSAYAGGYGYHRGSAAMAQALYNAGIDLDESISGVGDTAMHSAVEAITRAIYPEAQAVDVIEAYA